MRLLVIVNVFEPDLGGGVLFSDLCYGLAERGFEVTVRCASSYYPEWRDKSGENGLRIRSETRRGVRIERFGLYIPRNPQALHERLIYEGSFCASLMRRLPRRGDYDAMMVFCPLLGAVAYAAACRRKTGLPLWLNVQDLPAEAAQAGGIGQGSWMVRVQDALFNEADAWSTISPAMIERLEPRRRRNQPILYLPNWLHASLARHLRAAPNAHGPASPVRLLYSGNLGAKQHLLELCRILHRSDAPFAFRIQAEGSGAGALRKWADETGDERFDVRGLSDEQELARALCEADFAVIPERPGTGGSFLPSKLIPALASGTPVLAVCDADSPLGAEMTAHRPGPLYAWPEAKNLPALLASVDKEAYAAWRANAAGRAAFYSRERILDRYAEELRRLRKR